MEILNTIGILMNMLGLLLIFIYGISPMTPKGGEIYIYSDEELKHKNTELHKKERKYIIFSYMGLFISLIGMAIQLVSIYY